MDRRTFLANSCAATAAAAGSIQTAADASVSSRGAKKLEVAIVGCGRMGQYFAEVYRRLPNTELTAIAEWNDERRPVVGERFNVDRLYKDVNTMLADYVPDIVAVITPTKFMKEAVVKSAEAGVKGVSTDKPIAARLSDADAMVDACRHNNVIFAGGNLQRAKWNVQQAAQKLHSGELGTIQGAAVHGWGGEISGGGCQHISVLRLLAGAEIDEVIAWGSPPEALKADKDDSGLNINGRFRLSTGIDCQVFGLEQKYGERRNRSGVDVWTEDAMVSWSWNSPRIFKGRDANGVRKEIDPEYTPFPWPEILNAPPLRAGDNYLVASIQSFVKAVETNNENELFVSGHDLRQALEVAIAAKQSAMLGSQAVSLPLKDRSLTLMPRPYRWLGGDAVGKPQSDENAAGNSDS
ncbi:MAG: Gfo/Idh/MocA family oxidoreductase [Fuerstiella sp.]|nr:Gfo/Idh/MocA family oxidoreductase [Fuerstiella sp.]